MVGLLYQQVAGSKTKVGVIMTRFTPAPPIAIAPVVIVKMTADALAKIEKLAPGITAAKDLQVFETYVDAFPAVSAIQNIDFDRYEVVQSRVMPIGGPDLEHCTAWRFTCSVAPRMESTNPEAQEAPAEAVPAAVRKRRFVDRLLGV